MHNKEVWIPASRENAPARYLGMIICGLSGSLSTTSEEA